MELSATQRLCALRLLVAICLLSFGAMVFQGWVLLKRTDEVRLEAQRVGQRLTDDLAVQIAARLDRVKKIVANLSDTLENQELTHESLVARLKQDAKSDPFLSGLTVAFQPFAFASEKRLYAPFYDKRKDQVVQLEEVYDYTDKDCFEDCRWYLEPVSSRRPTWTTGYGNGMSDQYVDYDAPFFTINEESGVRQVRGTVNATIALRSLSNFLNKQKIGRLGGGFLIDSAGQILADPTGAMLRSGMTLLEHAEESGERHMCTLARRMTAGETGIVPGKDPQSGQPVITYHRPIPSSDWSLGVMVVRDEVTHHSPEIRHRQIWLMLTGLTLALSIAALVTKAYELRGFSAWTISHLFVVGSVALIGMIWYLGIAGDNRAWRNSPDTFLINDQTSLNRYLNDEVHAATSLNLEPPTVIPTGIFVRTIEFVSAHELQLKGQVWQHFDKQDHEHVQQGVVFANASPRPRSVQIREAFRRENDQSETVGWDFTVTIRVNLDYSRYPFDCHRVPLHLTPVNASPHVLLAPALDDYEMVNARSKPGLHDNLRLPEWWIDGSSFSYQKVHYNTDFGMNLERNPDGTNELQFNIQIARRSLTPFLSHIFPNVVIAILLFAVLLSSNRNKEEKPASGFTGMGVLQICAAYFFTVVLVHVNLRRSLGADNMTYMEWLLLILYLMLMLVAMNGLVLTNAKSFKIFEFRNNLLAKVLYGPTLMSLVLLVTVLTFY